MNRLVIKIDDSSLIRVFEKVAKINPNSTITFHDDQGQLDDALLKKLKRSNAYYVSTAIFSISGMSWSYSRIRANESAPQLVPFDRFSRTPQPTIGREELIDIQTTFDAALDAAATNSEAKPSLGHTTDSSEVMAALGRVNERLLSETADYRLKLDHEFAQRESSLREQLAEELKARIAFLEEEKRRSEADLSSRFTAISEREASVEALKKSLDDRNNTHVRREVRNSLQALAEGRLKNFNLTRETRVHQIAVHAVALLGLASLGGLALTYASQTGTLISSDASQSLILIASVKSALGVSSAIALSVWYLRWLSAWLNRVATSEFDLQRFRLDVERSSWLAEMLLEWKATSNDPFPELLADKLSRGLFSASESEASRNHTPATAVAEALFGAAASARLKVGENEVTLDRKSISSLEKG